MNVTTYQTMLSALLVDSNGNPLSPTQLNIITAKVVTEYSRWRGLLRTFGCGGLALNASPASQQITVVGGPYSSGQTIYLDAFTQFQETAVIDSIAQINPADEPILVGTPMLLNLVAPTVNVHYAGGIAAGVNPNNILGTGGLNIVAGQAQYAMPLDFLSPEDNSWNIATGQRSYLKQYQTFYDSIYEFSTLVQGVDLGQSQNFYGGEYYGFPGVPANPSGALNVPSAGAGSAYIFTGSGQVILNCVPAPQSSRVLNFNYWALQQPETVPPSDMDALLDLGIYVGVQNNAMVYSALPDWRDIRQDEVNSRAGANSMELASAAKARFDTSIRLRPLAISG